ncbi:MAG: TlpA family protein disulfide reductase, partial [Nitrososphaerales archaeon]
CPGCFLYGIPEAIDIHKKYGRDGVTVMGLATAFEDYDKNTLENLELLLKTGEVIGETRNVLGQHSRLDGNKLPYKIPFRVAMDSLKKESADLSQGKVMDFIETQFPDFRSYSEQYRAEFVERVKQYLRSKQYAAETFEEYALRGTPSSILIDKKGILRHVGFGQNGFLENVIQTLLKE